MKTLVIHPDDRSTDFLKVIYKDKDWTILNDWVDKINRNEFRKMVKNHDRIIMMGHGGPSGLFFSYVNPQLVQILREKECVSIWCNADQFVDRYKLSGFHTGMFISEVSEAFYFGITATQDEIDHSNNLFVKLMAENIDSPDVLNTLLKEYMGDSPVIQFNNARLYEGYKVGKSEILEG